jgi:hypothetical protein
MPTEKSDSYRELNHDFFFALFIPLLVESNNIAILRLHALVDFFIFIQDLQHVSALMKTSSGKPSRTQ